MESQTVELGIEVRQVTKRYGSTVALDELSFRVRPGLVTGLVGPNGAGKSTVMRVMILGLAAPDSGVALVGGVRYAQLDRPLRRVGALLDAWATHPSRRAVDHLRWMAASNGIDQRRIGEVLELVGLESVARRRTGGFSLGMAQRLGIAAALLGDPRIVLLDEPANGLDPDGIIWIRSLLRRLADEGRVVLVSSHLIGELEDTADRVIVLGRGRLLADAAVSELRAGAGPGGLTLRTPDRAAVMALLSEAGATVTWPGGDVVTVVGLPAGRVAELVVSAGLRLDSLVERRASLEDAYLRLTAAAVDYRAEQTQVQS